MKTAQQILDEIHRRIFEFGDWLDTSNELVGAFNELNSLKQFILNEPENNFEEYRNKLAQEKESLIAKVLLQKNLKPDEVVLIENKIGMKTVFYPDYKSNYKTSEECEHEWQEYNFDSHCTKCGKKVMET